MTTKDSYKDSFKDSFENLYNVGIDTKILCCYLSSKENVECGWRAGGCERPAAGPGRTAAGSPARRGGRVGRCARPPARTDVLGLREGGHGTQIQMSHLRGLRDLQGL